MQKIFTKSLPNHEASRKLATDLVQNYLLPAGHFTLFLEGGLGAGKTFLAKEILQQLGVCHEISSPTYALVNEYETKDAAQKFCHWDFYRLEDVNDFFARGFQDLADDTTISHLAEWPERLSPEAKASFGGQRFVLKIEFGIGVGMRKVKLLKA